MTSAIPAKPVSIVFFFLNDLRPDRIVYSNSVAKDREVVK